MTTTTSAMSAAVEGGVGTLSTPALVVDLDVFDANVRAMARIFEGTGKTLRPHAKTHRTPELARRQLGGAAVGVTCATVGEAEAMVAAGIDDVLIANEIVDPAKLARVAALAHDARITLAADDPAPVAALSRAATSAGVTIGVLVDVDVLLHRCGVTSAAEAVALAEAIDRQPGVRLAGIMGYEGRLRAETPERTDRIEGAYLRLAEVRDALIGAGFGVDVVSAAGTSTLREAVDDPVISELQCGVYALMEPQLEPLGLPFRCATTIRGTVISRHPGRAVLDIGRRAVGVEYGPPLPTGFAADSVTVNDEHTILALPAGVAFELGSQLELVPGQIRTTFNLHDHVWLSRGGSIVDRWPVSARGRSG
jgi:D-serine deaminase-like pyridoxal phosphate-dependent protein